MVGELLDSLFMGTLLCKPRCGFSPWVGVGSSYVFEVDGGFSGAFSSYFFRIVAFHGQSVLPFTVRGSFGFSLGMGVLLREGEMSMFYFGHHFIFLFSVGGFFYTFQV